jgi:hypothetical protein
LTTMQKMDSVTHTSRILLLIMLEVELKAGNATPTLAFQIPAHLFTKVLLMC